MTYARLPAPGLADTAWRDRLGTVSVWVAIAGIALALRLPSLLSVPYFSDEGVEVLWGLDITIGRHLPLTGADPYYGPLFSYLMAGLFFIFGVHPLIPGVTVAVFGALIPVMVYELGQLHSGRVAGVVAAGLTATSPILVVFSSHLSWASSLVPFFMTATVLTLIVARSRSSRVGCE